MNTILDAAKLSAKRQSEDKKNGELSKLEKKVRASYGPGSGKDDVTISRLRLIHAATGALSPEEFRDAKLTAQLDTGDSADAAVAEILKRLKAAQSSMNKGTSATCLAAMVSSIEAARSEKHSGAASSLLTPLKKLMKIYKDIDSGDLEEKTSMSSGMFSFIQTQAKSITKNTADELIFKYINTGRPWFETFKSGKELDMNTVNPTKDRTIHQLMLTKEDPLAAKLLKGKAYSVPEVMDLDWSECYPDMLVNCDGLLKGMKEMILLLEVDEQPCFAEFLSLLDLRSLDGIWTVPFSVSPGKVMAATASKIDKVTKPSLCAHVLRHVCCPVFVCG